MNATDMSRLLPAGLLAEILAWTTLASFVLLLLMILAHRLNPQTGVSGRDVKHAGARRSSAAARAAGVGPSVDRASSRGASTDRRPIRFLIVVSRSDPARHAELTRVFLRAENTEVIFDRRHGDRRSLRMRISVDRRRADRRQRPTEEDLRTTGWALLRLPA
jgi:hypothetical protein